MCGDDEHERLFVERFVDGLNTEFINEQFQTSQHTGKTVEIEIVECSKKHIWALKLQHIYIKLPTVHHSHLEWTKTVKTASISTESFAQ